MSYSRALSLAIAALLLSAIQPARAELIQNGGFESGNFTGWTQGGNTSFTSVGTDSSGSNWFFGLSPHNGSYFAAMGPNGTDGTLSQTFNTTSGQNYTLSYFLSNNNASYTPVNDFAALINGSILPGSSISNAGDFPYAQYSFGFTATGASTTLQFSFRNDPWYFGLDDVSVVPGGTTSGGTTSGGTNSGGTNSGGTTDPSAAIPEPSTCLVWGMALGCLLPVYLVRRKRAFAAC